MMALPMGSFQFSLRTLLAMIVAASITAAVLIAKPIWLAGLGLYILALIYPAVFLVGAITAERTRRPFCVGALLPASVGLTLVFAEVSAYLIKYQINSTELEHLQSAIGNLTLSYRLILAVTWAAMPLAGIVCSLANWLLFNSNRDKAGRNGG